MIYTARQLDDLHRASNDGELVLPYGARLTPLARDWARSRKVTIGYSDIEAAHVNARPIGADEKLASAGVGSALFWWCDGSCGAAKAALASVAKENPLNLREIAIDPRRGHEVARLLSRELGQGGAGVDARHGAAAYAQSPGGAAHAAALAVLFVQNAAAIMVYTNRCRSLRAVLGTTLKAVDLAVTTLAANVLVVEYPDKSVLQIRNVLSRFVKGPRNQSDEMKRNLAELSACE